MSVDERLREAFGGTDPAWQSRVPDALGEVTTRHRRETVVRRVAAATVVAAAVVVGGVAVAHESTDRSAPMPPTSRSPSPSAFPAASDHPLDGTWTTASLTRADVRRAAESAGDAGDFDAMLAELPTPPFRIVLVINEAGNSMLLKVRAGGHEQVFDEANVEVTDDRMVLHPRFATGENVHSWTVVDDALRLTFVSTTEGDSDGVPAEAWQRLLYDAAAFTH